MNQLLRQFLLSLRKLPLAFESRFDKQFLAPDVPMPRIVSHAKWRKYLYEIGNQPGMRILEIGSREVTGTSSARNAFAKAEYIGFDYYEGNNVDIVGDAHKLSQRISRKKNKRHGRLRLEEGRFGECRRRHRVSPAEKRTPDYP